MTLQTKNIKSTKISTTQNKKTFKNLKKSKIKVGDICVLKISALGPKNIGIDEYSYPYSIFVPNTHLGDTVKAKIVKTNLKENKYAIGEVVETMKKSSFSNNLPIQSDEILTLNIEKLTLKGTAIIDLKGNYKLIIPNAKIGNDQKIMITRLKSKYGFGKLVNNLDLSSLPSSTGNSMVSGISSISNNFTHSNLQVKQLEADQISKSLIIRKKNLLKSPLTLLEGSKYTLILPKEGNYYGKYAIVKLQGSVLFINLSLGAKPGNKVRIKLTKVNQKFAIAKIIQINHLQVKFKIRLITDFLYFSI